MVQRVGDIDLQVSAQQCVWCGFSLVTPPVTVSGAADPSDRARAVSVAKASTHRAHMLARHPQVLAALA